MCCLIFLWLCSVASVFIEDNFIICPVLIPSSCAFDSASFFLLGKATSQYHLLYTSFWHFVWCKGDQWCHRAYELSGWLFLFCFAGVSHTSIIAIFFQKESVSPNPVIVTIKELENVGYFNVECFIRKVKILSWWIIWFLMCCVRPYLQVYLYFWSFSQWKKELFLNKQSVKTPLSF